MMIDIFDIVVHVCSSHEQVETEKVSSTQWMSDLFYY